MLDKKNHLTTNLAEELPSRLRIDSARWDFTRSEKVFDFYLEVPSDLGLPFLLILLESRRPSWCYALY